MHENLASINEKYTHWISLKKKIISDGKFCLKNYFENSSQEFRLFRDTLYILNQVIDLFFKYSYNTPLKK
jgi:hypothetical protein